jgi:hypothetical protein
MDRSTRPVAWRQAPKARCTSPLRPFTPSRGHARALRAHPPSLHTARPSRKPTWARNLGPCRTGAPGWTPAGHPRVAGHRPVALRCNVFGCLPNGLYGLDTMLVEGVLRALAVSPARKAPPGSTRSRWAGCWGWTGRRRSRRSAARSPTLLPPGADELSCQPPAVSPGQRS